MHAKRITLFFKYLKIKNTISANYVQIYNSVHCTFTVDTQYEEPESYKITLYWV